MIHGSNKSQSAAEGDCLMEVMGLCAPALNLEERYAIDFQNLHDFFKK